jgi:hypothetical protein
MNTKAQIELLAEDGFTRLREFIGERRKVDVCAADNRDAWTFSHYARPGCV